MCTQIAQNLQKSHPNVKTHTVHANLTFRIIYVYFIYFFKGEIQGTFTGVNNTFFSITKKQHKKTKLIQLTLNSYVLHHYSRSNIFECISIFF